MRNWNSSRPSRHQAYSLLSVHSFWRNKSNYIAVMNPISSQYEVLRAFRETTRFEPTSETAERSNTGRGEERREERRDWGKQEGISGWVLARERTGKVRKQEIIITEGYKYLEKENSSLYRFHNYFSVFLWLRVSLHLWFSLKRGEDVYTWKRRIQTSYILQVFFHLSFVELVPAFMISLHGVLDVILSREGHNSRSLTFSFTQRL